MQPAALNNNKKRHFARRFSFFMIWLLACAIGFYFRLYPLTHYTSNEASEKATLLVLSNLRKHVRTAIDQNSPHLSAFEKNRLLKKQFDSLLHDEKQNVQETIYKVAHDLDNKNPASSKIPYLLASDSFYYFRLTRNILQTGKISETVKGSKYLNRMMLAPLGHWEPLNLHPFVGFSIYKIMSFFRPAISLMYSVSFTPLVIMALALIPLLFICAIHRCSLPATLLGAVYFVLSPIFLKRSTFGWYDNDPYNTLFPLAILAVLFYGLGKRQSTRLSIRWACVCCFCISLYALFWHGWVLLESIIVIAGIFIILFNHFVVKEKAVTKNLLITFGIIILGTFAGICILFGMKEFFILFQEGWIALKGFLQPQVSLWPDLYIAVGELRRATLPFIIDLTGGYVFFVVALLGLLSAFSKAVRRTSFFSLFILAVFLVVSLIITMGAQRFALFCLVPLSLLFPPGIQFIFQLIQKTTARTITNTKLHRPLNFIFIFLCAIGLLSIPLRTAGQKVPTLLNQIFNDTWHKALVRIEQETPPDSIINSWWPPGHFITSMAKRRVTFDGATINKPQAYWMANIFLSPDERQALGLLRMLNNSGHLAAEYLVSLRFKLSEAVNMIKAITSLNAQEARQQLESLLSPEEINQLLQLTHQPPPPSYFLLYNDLIEKNIQLSFVGNWDFQKIEEIKANSELLRKVPAPGSKDYIKFLWDISGGQPKYSTVLAPLAQTEEKIIFPHQITIDLKHKVCKIESKKFGQGIPYSLFYQENGNILEKKHPHANLPYSVLLFKNKGTYHCLLLDSYLARSLLMRLYFFEGKGLKYIRPFFDESDFTKRTRITVFHIDWEKFLSDVN